MIRSARDLSWYNYRLRTAADTLATLDVSLHPPVARLVVSACSMQATIDPPERAVLVDLLDRLLPVPKRDTPKLVDDAEQVVGRDGWDATLTREGTCLCGTTPAASCVFGVVAALACQSVPAVNDRGAIELQSGILEQIAPTFGLSTAEAQRILECVRTEFNGQFSDPSDDDEKPDWNDRQALQQAEWDYGDPADIDDYD